MWRRRSPRVASSSGAPKPRVRHLNRRSERLTSTIDSSQRAPALPSGTTESPPFRAIELAAPALLATGLVLVAFREGARVADDAYITFRYARNLAEGAGLVYNIGERVLGTSAPLFAVLLAALRRITGVAIPSLAVSLGAFGFVTSALIGYRLARRVGGPLLANAFVVAALTPRETLRVAASGMETPLLLAGLLGAVELSCRGRCTAAFAVASGLYFVHPDAVLLVPAIALAVRIGSGRWPVRQLTRGLAPAALMAAILSAAYGTPIPHSVVAKRAAYAMPGGHAFALLTESALDAVIPRDLPWGVAVAPLAALLLLVAVLIAGRRAFREPATIAVVGYGALAIVVFGVANPLMFDWYRPPAAVAGAFAVAACAARLERRMGSAVAAILLLGGVSHVATFTPYETSNREDEYARVVGGLSIGPGDVVAAPEIGVVGWATRARVLDTVGLVTPEALRWLEVAPSWGVIPPRLLRETDADLLVTSDRFLAPALAADPGALERWVEIAIPAGRLAEAPGPVRAFRRFRR
jgi:hypothetical protein